MARKKKAPEKLHKWYRVRESGGKGKRRISWDVTIDSIRYGMSFSDLRTEMELIESEHKDDFESFRIEPQDEYDYGDEHPHTVFYVEGLRWETDEEYDDRIAAAARIEAEREALRRAQYEKLAKEFGDKV